MMLPERDIICRVTEVDGKAINIRNLGNDYAGLNNALGCTSSEPK